ncbi:MAG: TcpQ domain-containing protein [Desulfovibrionaceae bacterium]|nr:TcpQ domain-containing protein [Desulfovibrionaceae bacterium]
MVRVVSVLVVSLIMGACSLCHAYYIENVEDMGLIERDLPGENVAWTGGKNTLYAQSTANQASAKVKAEPLRPGLMVHGRDQATLLSGEGHKLPLITAMSIIVPHGFKVEIPKHLEQLRVSFKVKKLKWSRALEALGHKYRLAFSLDFNQKKVRVVAVPGSNKTSKQPACKAQSKPPKEQQVVPKEHASKQQTPQQNVAPERVKDATYSLSPGRLAQQLASWCKTAGYELIWQAPYDFEVRLAANYGANFEAALAQILRTLKAEGAALQVTLYVVNRVLEVRGE